MKLWNQGNKKKKTGWNRKKKLVEIKKKKKKKNWNKKKKNYRASLYVNGITIGIKLLIQ